MTMENDRCHLGKTEIETQRVVCPTFAPPKQPQAKKIEVTFVAPDEARTHDLRMTRLP